MITRVSSRARHRAPSPCHTTLCYRSARAEPAASVSRLVPFIIGAGLLASKDHGADWSPTPRRRVAGRSHEVELPFRVFVCNAVVSLLGRSRPPRSWPFPADPRGFPGATVPRLLRVRVHPLLGFASSSEIQPLGPAHRAHAVNAFLGVPPLHRDISAKSPLGGRVPVPAYVPPSAFRTLSTACSSSHLAGLFHPAATSEVPSSGVFPAGQPAGLITRRFPLAVGGPCLPESCPSGASSDRLDFKAFIRPSIRCRAPAG
jgi:hypothetical protein